MFLQDSSGRHIHKLRVQLTDVCNFRCFYCMPEGTRFLPANDLLRPSEIINICSALNHFGVDEIRVTGGEPTVRPEFDEIMTQLAQFTWRKFGLTSNGYLLADKLDLLQNIGCKNINISLDSLDPNRFHLITRRPFFAQVLAAIIKAANMGFDVKVNAVIARGTNDDELQDFLNFGAEHGLEVRFLELMKVGPSIAQHENQFISAQSMLERLRLTNDLEPDASAIDSTSFGFRTNRGSRIGFIASESQPFCSTCSRLRLTATGKLRACLFSKDGLDLRGRDPLDYPEILKAVMAMKPTARLENIMQPMNQIGG
jgi:GTP 3',8-cyclase